MILLCLASSTTPRRRNLLVTLAQYSVTHFRSSSTKPSSWFLSSLILWAGFPSPINTSGSACFRSENWLEFITTEKAGYLYYFQIFFHLGMKSFCLSPQTSRSESSSSPCSMIYSEDGTDDFLIDVSDFNVPSNE